MGDATPRKRPADAQRTEPKREPQAKPDQPSAGDPAKQGPQSKFHGNTKKQGPQSKFHG